MCERLHDLLKNGANYVLVAAFPVAPKGITKLVQAV